MSLTPPPKQPPALMIARPLISLPRISSSISLTHTHTHTYTHTLSLSLSLPPFSHAHPKPLTRRTIQENFKQSSERVSRQFGYIYHNLEGFSYSTTKLTAEGANVGTKYVHHASRTDMHNAGHAQIQTQLFHLSKPCACDNPLHYCVTARLFT